MSSNVSAPTGFARGWPRVMGEKFWHDGVQKGGLGSHRNGVDIAKGGAIIPSYSEVDSKPGF